VEGNQHNNRRAVFSVVTAMLIAQQCSKHTSAPVNQYATIVEEVFSVGAILRLYKKDLRQLDTKTDWPTERRS
jgi:hypothetical protein